MRVYFDTNIYRFIAERNETHDVAKLLKKLRCTLMASAGTLFETYAIESHERQQHEMQVIVQLADRFEAYPASYLHALEVRREIKRLRPKWLVPVVPRRNEQRFLRHYRELWRGAQAGVLPTIESRRQYKRDAEHGISTIRRTQKEVRELMAKSFIEFIVKDDPESVRSEDYGNPEVYWRIEGLLVWYQAIEARLRASRDYADWLLHYLRPGSFRGASYTSFWLDEVASDAMPLNRLTGLVSFYQLQQKISHGNAADQIHATSWFRSDLFVTADRSFHEALTRVATQHYPGKRLPALVQRSGHSFVSQLAALIARESR